MIDNVEKNLYDQLLGYNEFEGMSYFASGASNTDLCTCWPPGGQSAHYIHTSYGFSDCSLCQDVSSMLPIGNPTLAVYRKCMRCGMKY